MIALALLEALREKDPETWDYIDTVLKLGFPMPGVCDPNGVIAGYIIQGSIQSAIQARGWSWELSTFTDRPYAKIFNQATLRYATCIGDSPAEALLRCYLEAII